MIRFLLKGLLRDRQRSLLPVIVVAAGVMLTVLMVCYLSGILGDVADFSARFSTGHVRIMTRAYADQSAQAPTDLSLLNVGDMLGDLQREFPEMEWVPRTRFGGLLDVPDEKGETRSQGTVAGIAVDLLSPGSKESSRLNLEKILVSGHLPVRRGEILISDEFAGKLKVSPGDPVTLMGSTMTGSMSFYNFNIAGTIKFGVAVLDKGAIIVDMEDAMAALDMDNASGEILGFLPAGHYDPEQAGEVRTEFNNRHTDPDDPFSPIMRLLTEENEMAGYLEMVDSFSFMIVFIFILAMSVVLWNSGLIGGLRRYGEVGVRLAMGEDKGHIYRSMIHESILVGIIGSIFGTLLGLMFSYWLQEKGIDISQAMKGATMMMPGKFHARIVSSAYYIGFIPGLFSSTLGTMLSGIGIYRRKTSQLFKELET